MPICEKNTKFIRIWNLETIKIVMIIDLEAKKFEKYDQDSRLIPLHTC